MSRYESDEEFFKDKICNHYSYIRKFLYSLTLDPVVAEDLFQETMCTCWRNIGKLRRYEKLKSALIVIARNEFLKYQRRKCRRSEELVPTENLSWIASNSNIDEFIERDALTHDLLAAFNGIEKKYVQVIVLADYYGFDLKEVANMLSLNYNTVVTRHTRGLKQMRERLAEIKAARDPKSHIGGSDDGEDR